MDTTVIIAIILSTIVALGIVVLVIVLFYAFIRENLKLKDEIERLRVGEQSSGIKLQEEKEELNDQLKEEHKP